MKHSRKIVCAIVIGVWGLGQLALAQSSSLMWGKPVPVKRVEKPRRTPTKPRPKPVRNKPVIEKVPLLALRWSARKGDFAKTPDLAKRGKLANPDDVFAVGDHLQLVVEVNQDGYLYMVQEETLTMIFPDKRINNGQNLVKKGQQIVIPSNCEKQYQDANGYCWFRVENKDDELTLIFSRDRIDDLPNSVDAEGTTVINKEKLAEVKSGSRQQFSKTNADAFTIQYTNLNRDDNEELIIETKIRHQ